jgi:hypothetical protein
MSDLSKVLGDLYGGDDQPSVAPPRNFRAEAPEWADDERLDEAFSSWTPGPPPEAHAMEREMSFVIDTPAVPAAHLDDDLAATLSAALVDAGSDNGEVDLPVASAPSYSLPALGEDPATMSFTDGLPVAPAGPAMAEMMTEVVPAYEPEPARPWTRADDDILPAAGKLPKLPKLPKAPKAKAPKANAKKAKAAKAPKPVAESGGKTLFGLKLRRK